MFITASVEMRGEHYSEEFLEEVKVHFHLYFSRPRVMRDQIVNEFSNQGTFQHSSDS